MSTFEKLWNGAYPKLLRTACNSLKIDDAEDLVSDTAVLACEATDRPTERAEFELWAIRLMVKVQEGRHS